MQICSATVRLSGSMNNTVHKSDLTPAEIVVLQTLHGTDAVIDVIHERDERRSHTEEYDRLTATYSRNSNISTPDGDPGDIVARLFPGAVRKLPVNLIEIGLGEAANMAISVAAAEAEKQKALLDVESDEEEAARLARELAELEAIDAAKAEARAKATAEADSAAIKEQEEEAAFLAKEAAEVAKLNAQAAADEEAELARLIAEDEDKAAAEAAAKIKK